MRRLRLGGACLGNADCAAGVCDMVGSNTCETADTCGNGAVETGEACDDGDVLTGDGCDGSCLKEIGAELHAIDRVRRRICLRCGDNGLKYV